MMAGTTYEPISQGEDIDINYQDISKKHRTAAADDVLAVRPPVYYNDGPFSPPSSVDESQEHLLGKDHDQFSSAERGSMGRPEDKNSRIRLQRASGPVLKVMKNFLS